MDDGDRFELEEEKELAHPPEPQRPMVQPPRKAPPPAEEDPPGRWRGLLTAKRKRRMRRFVPGMGLAFLLVGWFGVGGACLWFLPVGAALGVFAAWRPRPEWLLGTVCAIAGFLTALKVGFAPGVFGLLAIVGCGAVGYLAALDDRLRGN